jgi:hypothetical protein
MLAGEAEIFGDLPRASLDSGAFDETRASDALYPLSTWW